MKKSIVCLAIFLSCGAIAMSSPQNADTAATVKDAGLKACLMAQAQAALSAGKLATTPLKTLAADIAKTCAVKLAMPQGADEGTISAASSILQTLSQQ